MEIFDLFLKKFRAAGFEILNSFGNRLDGALDLFLTVAFAESSKNTGWNNKVVIAHQSLSSHLSENDLAIGSTCVVGSNQGPHNFIGASLIGGAHRVLNRVA